MTAERAGLHTACASRRARPGRGPWWRLAVLVTALLAVALTSAPSGAGADQTGELFDRTPARLDDFADPHVIRVGDTYYAYATNAGANTPVARSTDLADWERLGDALPPDTFPAWAMPGRTWAPGVIEAAGRFVLFLSIARRDDTQCLAVTTAASPVGPFADALGGPLTCGLPGSLGAIDPFPFQAPDGRLFLLWKDAGSRRQIWGQEL